VKFRLGFKVKKPLKGKFVPVLDYVLRRGDVLGWRRCGSARSSPRRYLGVGGRLRSPADLHPRIKPAMPQGRSGRDCGRGPLPLPGMGLRWSIPWPGHRI